MKKIILFSIFSLCQLVWAGTITLTIGNPPTLSRPTGYSSSDSCLGPIQRATTASTLGAALLRWSACSNVLINTTRLKSLKDSDVSSIKNASTSDETLKVALCSLENPLLNCQANASKATTDSECQAAIGKAILVIDRDRDEWRDTPKYYAAYAVDMPQKCFIEAKNLCSKSKEAAELPVLTPSGLGTFDLGSLDPTDNYEIIHSVNIIYGFYFSNFAYSDPPKPFNFFNGAGQCLKWGSNPDPAAGDPPPDVWVPCSASDRISHVICR